MITFVTFTFFSQRGKAGVYLRPVLPFFSFVLFLCLLNNAAPVLGADSPLPIINRLDSRDPIFRQYLLDVEAARRVLFSSRRSSEAAEALAASLTIYSYTPQEREDLLGVAARCNIPYSSLASLNRFTHPDDFKSASKILIPSIPGIFVSYESESDLEKLLSSARAGPRGVLLSVPKEAKAEQFRFIPGDDFNPTERVFFFNRGFRFPLRHFTLSSAYGSRINPVTGRAGTHRGIDLAAPEGSEVYASRGGRVIDLGENEILGKYIMLEHDNNWVSVYGHLSSINILPGSSVQAGALIGRVGSTGQSTGPHLHFELIQNGKTRDPAQLLRLFSFLPARPFITFS